MASTEQFSVKGMTCDNCVRHVEKALRSITGVSSVTVDLNRHHATVEYDPTVATKQAMASAVSEAGYTLE